MISGIRDKKDKRNRKDTADKEIAEKKASAEKKKEVFFSASVVGVEENTVKKVVKVGEDLLSALDTKEPVAVLDILLQKLESGALKQIHEITDSKSDGNNQWKLKQTAVLAFGKDAEDIEDASKKLAGVIEGLETVFEYCVTKAFAYINTY